MVISSDFSRIFMDFSWIFMKFHAFLRRFSWLQRQKASLQEASSSEHFLVRRIEFLGRQVPILLQNRNGPCGLLAIANGLLLRGACDLGTREERISGSVAPGSNGHGEAVATCSRGSASFVRS